MTGGGPAWLDPAPFLRGAAWAGTPEVPYPRADPADAARLPQDTWTTAQLPVGVRLELALDPATAPVAVEIDYSCATADLGYRGPGAGTTFDAWRGGSSRASAAAEVGRHVARLDVPAADEPEVVIYLPEGMRPALHGLRTAGAAPAAAAAGPRWLAYGDSITEGWTASRPALAWPAIAARRFGLDVVNLGYAGAARGEIASAEQVSTLPADVISLAYGTNCWNRTPHSTGLLREGLLAFLRILREGHPGTPIVVVSPVLRPDAETTPNRLGATLADLRAVVETVAREVREAGDGRLSLVRGGELLSPGHLADDGIHPNDAGHAAMAEVIGPAVQAAARASRAAGRPASTATRVPTIG